MKSDDHAQRFPDCVRCHIYDTDQTDFAEPVSRGVWNGVIVTIVLLGFGVGLMGMLIYEDTPPHEVQIYERSYR